MAKDRDERKMMLRAKLYEGWLAWQQREEGLKEAEREKKRRQKADAKEMREKKRKALEVSEHVFAT